MKTRINKIEADWLDVKNKCRTTVGKDYSEQETTSGFKRKILISEHSPIRLLKINFSWEGIKSWIATHFSRSTWECFITTQRSDRTGKNRDEIKQGALVNFDGEMNSQHLIDTSRKRLCYQASKETREYMEDLKYNLLQDEDTKEMADVMTPNCIYRNGCPEFSPCKYFENFIENKSKEELCNIKIRYDLYNKEFYSKFKESESDNNELDTKGQEEL